MKRVDFAALGKPTIAILRRSRLPCSYGQCNHEADNDSEDGAGEDVGRVVHAEIGTANGQRERQDESKRAKRVDPGHRRGNGAGRDGVGWAEGKLSELGAPPSGGSPSSTGRGLLTRSWTA